MALVTDDRENLEPGMTSGLLGTGLVDGPTAQAPADEPSDPFAGYEDYFGFDERELFYFPDGKQFLQFQRLTEGQRAKYLKATRQDVTISTRSGDARVPFDQSNDRKQLIVHSVTGWNVVRRNGKGQWNPVPFSSGSPGAELEKWIDSANPAIIAQVEKAIRKANPWLMADMTVEQIDKEIADLQELRKTAADREASEKNS